MKVYTTFYLSNYYHNSSLNKIYFLATKKQDSFEAFIEIRTRISFLAVINICKIYCAEKHPIDLCPSSFSAGYIKYICHNKGKIFLMMIVSNKSMSKLPL